MSMDVWTASLNRSRATNLEGLAFDTRFVVGRRAKTIAGFARAAMNGTPSTREESVQLVSIGGRKPNAFRAVAGHSTRIGITIHGIGNRERIRPRSRQHPP
jgi:hypothetical protein